MTKMEGNKRLGEMGFWKESVNRAEWGEDSQGDGRDLQGGWFAATLDSTLSELGREDRELGRGSPA